MCYSIPHRSPAPWHQLMSPIPTETTSIEGLQAINQRFSLVKGVSLSPGSGLLAPDPLPYQPDPLPLDPREGSSPCLSPSQITDQYNALTHRVCCAFAWLCAWFAAEKEANSFTLLFQIRDSRKRPKWSSCSQRIPSSSNVS